MGYCNKQHVENIIAQAITSGTKETLNGLPANLVNLGNSFKNNAVPDSIIEEYIRFADSEINANLSELYVTPLKELADWETTLAEDVTSNNVLNVHLDEVGNLVPADVLVFVNDSVEQKRIIDSIDYTTYIVTLTTALSEAVLADGSRVIRIRYPDPITLVSARIASANLYDKYFSAQSDPNESNFGKFLRSQARREIDNILNGRTILHGAHRIGNRFVNSTLKDRYGLPGVEGSDRNIDDVGR